MKKAKNGYKRIRLRECIAYIMPFPDFDTIYTSRERKRKYSPYKYGVADISEKFMLSEYDTRKIAREKGLKVRATRVKDDEKTSICSVYNSVMEGGRLSNKEIENRTLRSMSTVYKVLHEMEDSQKARIKWKSEWISLQNNIENTFSEIDRMDGVSNGFKPSEPGSEEMPEPNYSERGSEEVSLVSSEENDYDPSLMEILDSMHPEKAAKPAPQ